MYRQIFKPTEYDHTIPIAIPREWYGQSVEIIVFPITASPETKPVTDEEFYKLSGAWNPNKAQKKCPQNLK
jgi:hypothetical protein